MTKANHQLEDYTREAASKPKTSTKQIAIFNLDERLIRSDLERALKVLALLKAIPVKVELMFHCRAFEYTAISERFKDVGDGFSIPRVSLEFVEDETGQLSEVNVRY